MIIAVECNADEALVRALIPGELHPKIKHAGGKGNVFNRLRKFTTGVGLIDEDPGSTQPRDFNEHYTKTEELGNIKLFQHKESIERRAVVLCPRLEEWFIARAIAQNIRPSDYNIPGDAKRLHSVAHYEKEPGFTDFLKRLIESDDEEVSKIRKWLTFE